MTNNNKNERENLEKDPEIERDLAKEFFAFMDDLIMDDCHTYLYSIILNSLTRGYETHPAADRPMAYAFYEEVDY